MKKPIFVVVIGVVVAAAIGATVWLALGNKGGVVKKGGEEPVVVEESGVGFGAQLFGNIQNNPIEKMPETNPFSQELNPYKDAYKNPFEK